MANRKKLLTHPEFQLKFLLWVSVGVTVVSAVFYSANYFFLQKFYDIGLDLGFEPRHPFFEFLDEQKKVLTRVFIGATLSSLIAFAIWGLFFSHRIAGALSKLKSEMDQALSVKEMKKIKFRKSDFFSEIAESYNDLVSRLKRG